MRDDWGGPGGPPAAGGWDDLRWVAAAVGNTRVRVGRMTGGTVEHAESAASGDADAVAAAVAACCGGEPGPGLSVIASVNPQAAETVRSALVRRLDADAVLRVGVDVPLAVRHALDDATTLGQDRALTAIAAYARSRQATVIVDAGTAVTVDFVDGEGVFHGGAIVPGLSMMLSSLHEHTAALPEVRFEMPAESRGPFGLDTAHAMRLGVVAAVRGAVRELLERYAERYGAYPQVVGTGGDIGVLDATGLVEHVVPDLQLLGIAEATRAALYGDDAEGAADDEL